MCGRYAFYGIEEFADEYEIPSGIDLRPNYNVAPTQTMPVVTQDGVKLMRWGLIPKWAKDEKIGFKLINARAETLFEKPMWRQVIKTKRCLIPANGFYEWQKRDDGKQPYFIHPEDQELFMFAGLWETWVHDDEELNTYSIITTTPNQEMESIHDRMPVILNRGDRDSWLGIDDEHAIASLLKPYRDKELAMYEVDTKVGNIRVNDESLLDIHEQ